MIQVVVGRYPRHQYHQGSNGGHYGDHPPMRGLCFGRILQLQRADLVQHVLLHALGEYQMRKAGIQRAEYRIIHRSDTILSVQIPGACAPGEVG